jgi:hypothetical protein
MAESDPARLDHRIPMPQATVNIVNRTGLIPGVAQAERADPVVHHELGFVQAREPWRAPPAPPSEEQLRQRLGAAIEAMHAAEAKLKEADSVYQRAEEHRKACQRKAAQFSGLDQELSVAMVESFRASEDPATVRERFSPQLSERAIIETENTAAASAAVRLQHELSDASESSANARQAVDTLIAQVLAHTADDLARECQTFLAEIERRKLVLLAFSKFAAPTKQFLAPVTREVLGGNISPQQVFRADLTPWLAAAEALHNDPQAEVEIPLEPMP